MEYGSRIRFGLFALGGILLLVLSIWGISSIAHSVIGGGNTKETTQVKKTDLADYAKPNTFVRLTIEGPVVASEDYQSYQIEVGQDYREIKIFSGYTKTVTSQQRYSNNNDSYDAFLKSLKHAGFTLTVKGVADKETGYCATGNRYVYELHDQDKQVERTWNTSCGSVLGSFAGLGSTVRGLFKAQIPDYHELTKNVSI